MPHIRSVIALPGPNFASLVKGVDHYLIAVFFFAVLSFAPAGAQTPRLIKLGEATSLNAAFSAVA